MGVYEFDISVLRENVEKLNCGDKVYLTGTVYTARDAAHSRIIKLLEEGKPLPFSPEGAVIYYAGPTPTRDDGQIGSFGPTTSSRMDVFTPVLLQHGLLATIGKGDRSKEVVEAIKENNAVYFCAGGGLGALISKCIRSVDVVAFPELGCESVKELRVERMPLITAVDCKGNSIFDRHKGE